MSLCSCFVFCSLWCLFVAILSFCSCFKYLCSDCMSPCSRFKYLCIYCVSPCSRFMIMTVRNHNLTSDSQPALYWCSSSRYVTPVESFIRSGDPVDRHVSCRAAPDQKTVFIEISSETGGGSLLFSAPQCDVLSLHHRDSRTVQDHRPTWQIIIYMIIIDVSRVMYWLRMMLHLQQFVLFKPTSHSDGNCVAALSCCRLTPVHSIVWWVDVIKVAVRFIYSMQRRGTLLINIFCCVPLNCPLRWVSLLLTVQRNRLILEELGSVGNDSENGCKTKKDGGKVRNSSSYVVYKSVSVAQWETTQQYLKVWVSHLLAVRHKGL